MINLKNTTIKAGLVVGLLALGFLSWSVPVLADDTPISPSGTAQNLEGIQVRDASEWPWAIGGEEPNIEENEQEDYQIKQSPDIVYYLKLHPASENWQDLNAGDTQRDSGEAQFVQF